MIVKNFSLRPYQQEALDSIPESGSYVICLFTGAGKTVCMSQIPRRGRMLILSHRDELVHQPEKYFDCSFGVEQGGETSHGEEIISASVQSLVRRLDKFNSDDFDVLVTDECFPAGVKVDGVPIELIREGDYVTAFNHKTRLPEKRRVVHVFKKVAPDYLISINNGELLCTANHPIYDANKKIYVEAEKLTLKTRLLSYSVRRQEAYVSQIGIEYHNPSEFVYNLEVEGLNNYFANGILVHNCHHATAPSYRKIYDYFKPRLH